MHQSRRPAKVVMSKTHLKFVIILGALAAFGPLAIDMYLPAFPAVAKFYNTNDGAVQATLAVYFAGLAIGQAFLGPLSDRMGRRIPLLGGIALFIAASLMAALAPNIETLALARFLQALGGCAGIVVSRAMVRDLFNERDSAQVYSMLMLVMGVAPILAPMAGGFIVAHSDWHLIFVILAIYGALCFVAVAWGLGETLPAHKHVKDGLAPIIRAYLALFRDVPFMAFSLANACISASMFAYITGSPFVFIELHGFTPSEFAILFGINACGIIGASQVNAWLLRRLPPHLSGRFILRVAITAHLIASTVLILATIFLPSAFWLLAVPVFLVVMCYGFVGANAVAAAMSRAGARVGAASALNGILQFVIAALAGGIVGALNDGTALPMAATIAFVSVAGFTSLAIARAATARETEAA